MRNRDRTKMTASKVVFQEAGWLVGPSAGVRRETDLGLKTMSMTLC
jgi:hypothetical protein